MPKEGGISETSGSSAGKRGVWEMRISHFSMPHELSRHIRCQFIPALTRVTQHVYVQSTQHDKCLS